MFRRELWPGAAQELNQQWVDAIETKIIEGHPDFSPYGEKEPIWFMQDPYPGWRQHELSRICFQCGHKKSFLDPYCLGSQIHAERMEMRRRYEQRRISGTLGLKPSLFRRRFR